VQWNYDIYALYSYIHTGHLQILNRQSQGATQQLSYSEADFRPAPLITSSTAAPEATTKKGGFFSGIAGYFKGAAEERNKLKIHK
jgi:hypothetical protein